MTFRFETSEDETGELPHEPHLSFSERAWRRLWLLTVRSSSEISGLGYVTQVGDDFALEDLFVVEQDVNDIATRLDDASVHRLIVEVVERDLDPSCLMLWWHSHATEGVFWSGEDEMTIDGFRNDGMISLVTNHAMKALARIDFYEPRQTRWVWIDRSAGAEMSGFATADDEEARAVDLEIARKLHPRPRSSPRIF